MSTRTFAAASHVSTEGMALGLAPALTPHGLDDRPDFFQGFAAYPHVLARGLVVLADITATRYFKFVPTSLRDPVLTAHGDSIRAECFSACNSVYARLDLDSSSFDTGEMKHGTTNVDINAATRTALTAVTSRELLNLTIGSTGMTVSTMANTVTERPVEMPPRWVQAFGNVAQLHQGLPQVISANTAQARSFIATIPASSSKNRDGWLAITRTGLRLDSRKTPNSVHISGIHRLNGIKRLLANITGVNIYGTAEPGPVVVEFIIPGGRVTLGLTDEAWRGHSGEGSLLRLLAGENAADDAITLTALLAFDPVIDVQRLSREAEIPVDRVESALAVLAADGIVGWDVHRGAYFHRELPHDPDRVEKDNPRLVRAQTIVAAGGVGHHDGGWQVSTARGTHTIRVTEAGESCTCLWSIKHGTSRGPCAHLLAVHLYRKASS